MALRPKKTKYRVRQKGRSKGLASRGTRLAFGSYGLKGLGRKWLTDRQIEAARMAIVRYLKRKGKLWIRIFPDKPITKKGTEVPMGGGKGTVDHYAFPLKPGRIIFELGGVTEEQAKEAFRRASHKLPIKTKFVRR